MSQNVLEKALFKIPEWFENLNPVSPGILWKINIKKTTTNLNGHILKTMTNSESKLHFLKVHSFLPSTVQLLIRLKVIDIEKTVMRFIFSWGNLQKFAQLWWTTTIQNSNGCLLLVTLLFAVGKFIYCLILTSIWPVMLISIT